MREVNAYLRACGQLRGDHPLIRLIQQCLHNLPAKRPGIREVLHLLEEARAGTRDEEWVQVQAHLRNQVRVSVLTILASVLFKPFLSPENGTRSSVSCAGDTTTASL